MHSSLQQTWSYSQLTKLLIIASASFVVLLIIVFLTSSRIKRTSKSIHRAILSQNKEEEASTSTPKITVQDQDEDEEETSESSSSSSSSAHFDEQYDTFFSELKSSSNSSVSFSSLEKFNCKRDSYWSSKSMKCLALISDYPLLPHEISGQELHCENKNEVEKWKSFGFKNEASFVNFSIAASTPMNETNVDQLYKNFQFASSWLFREWKEWKPKPKFVFDSRSLNNSNNIKDKEANFVIKGDHDPNLENIFKLQNFCVEPFEGISGYFPVNATPNEEDERNLLKPYRGKDDTRNRYHGEKTFGSFFNPQRILRLSEPPRFFDERPVIFLRIAPISRFHIYHTLNKFMSVLGMIRLLREKNEITSRNDDDDNDNDETSSKPLIIFVNEEVDDTYGASQSPALAFLYQILYDFPWASVSVPIPMARVMGTKVNVGNFISDQYHQKLFNLTNHFYSDDFMSRARHSSTRKDYRLCFRKAFLYQNCFDCDIMPHEEGAVGPFSYERESYSFGMWQTSNENRVASVREYRRLIDERCLMMPPQKLIIKTKKNNKVYRLPNVYIPLRTHSRIIRDFPLIFEALNHSVVKSFINEVRVREPSPSSSRLVYTKEIRTSDVFVGIHGGDFGMTSLLPEKAIVVEFTFATQMCHLEKSSNGIDPSTLTLEQNSSLFPKRCWFGVYVDAVPDSDHWLVNLKRYHRFQPQITLPLHIMIDTIRDASCRWLFKKYSEENDDDDGLMEIVNNKKKSDNDDNDNDLDLAKMKMKPSKRRVIQAMRMCLRRNYSTESSIIVKTAPWNKRYREIVIPSLDAYLNIRYLRFLWFTFNPSSIDIFADSQVRKEAETKIKNLRSFLLKDDLNSVQQQQSLITSLKFVASPKQSVITWKLVLNRLLAVDDGQKVFNSVEEELKHAKNDKITVREQSKDDGSSLTLLGCLPFIVSADNSEKSCLYVAAG